jgi:Ca2+-binding RTX toxin-like protein
MKRLFLAAVLALLALPSLAQASTCQRVGGAVAVHMDQATDVVTLSRVGDAIYEGIKPCDDATVHNIGAIFVIDTTPNNDGNDYVGIDLGGGPFAPGTGSTKNGRVPEITFDMYLGHGDNSVLVSGTGGADTIRGGRKIDANGHYLQGLNLNPTAEEQPGKVADPDVIWQYATPDPNPPENEHLMIDAGGGPDTIDLSGGPGFDTALYADTQIAGGSGDDHLTGGDGADTFFAEPGNDVMNGGSKTDWITFQTSLTGVTVDLSNPDPQDNGALGKDTYKSIEVVEGSQHDDVLMARNGNTGLYGMGGDDLLVASPYTDGLDGGPGNDTVSYARSPNGVSIDLGIADGTSQITGGSGYDGITAVENLIGSPQPDVLTGDGGPNTIDGGGGPDSISGKGGADTLLMRDGVQDQATCGDGSDEVVADVKGTDAIFGDCESVDFAPAPVVQQPPPPPPGSPTPIPPATGDHMAPVLSALKLKGRTLSYRLSEAATVRFGIQLKSGRRWKTLRARTQSGAAGANKLRFSRRGRYRVTAVATDAAGNKSKQRAISFRVKR